MVNNRRSFYSYFTHDLGSRNDPKIVKMAIKMGHEGKGIYWDLVEILYEQNGYIKISDLEVIAFSINCDLSKVKRVLFEFDLFKKDTKRIWSDSALTRIKIKEGKSKKASQASNKRWKQNADAMQTHSERDANEMHSVCDSNAIKEKEKKEKEIGIFQIPKNHPFSRLPVGDARRVEYERMSPEERKKVDFSLNNPL